jgi:large-conductance mechanosensitive channel
VEKCFGSLNNVYTFTASILFLTVKFKNMATKKKAKKKAAPKKKAAKKKK